MDKVKLMKVVWESILITCRLVYDRIQIEVQMVKAAILNFRKEIINQNATLMKKENGIQISRKEVDATQTI